MGVEIKYIKSELADMKSELGEIKKTVFEIKDKLAERQTVNGIQTATLEVHEKELSELEARIDKLEGRHSSLSRNVYIGMGIVITISFLGQVVPLILNLLK